MFDCDDCAVPPPDNARWAAVLRYRSEAVTVVMAFRIEEIGDLHEIVENGPHWDTVISIEITRINHNENPTLTIEAAAKL